MQEGKINLEEDGLDGWSSRGGCSHVTYREVFRKLDDLLERKKRAIQGDCRPLKSWDTEAEPVSVCVKSAFFLDLESPQGPVSVLAQEKVSLHPSWVYHGIPECQNLEELR